jgi:tRNA1Val (adenine37-N6)-methyltransferase
MNDRPAPGDDETLDRLGGDWWIFQLLKGHRFSTDDLATAWRASIAAPEARVVLDLGCGIGSVGLSTLLRLDPTGERGVRMVGVEAQEISLALARKTVAWNRLGDRVELHHGDLREFQHPDRFALITGSPPYIPEGRGLLSPFPQRAACRIELRGSLYDYCATARRHLAKDGRFCFVMAAADPRTEDAPRVHDLVVLERWDWIFRSGRPPLVTTLVCARNEDGPFPPRVQGALTVRDVTGRWTQEYLAFRAAMGAPASVFAQSGV